MIDIHRLIKQQRPQVSIAIPSPMESQNADAPNLRWGGKTITPTSPVYAIIRRLILKKYGIGK